MGQLFPIYCRHIVLRSLPSSIKLYCHEKERFVQKYALHVAAHQSNGGV